MQSWSEALLSRTRGWLALPLLALLTVLADRVTKTIIVNNLALNQSWNPISGLERLVSVTYVTNTGAAFGLFPDLGGVFVVIAVFVVVAILIYYHQLPQGYGLVRVALGLQLGGALGNLIDRLTLGHVIDFIDFKVWPVFNVADSAIVVGIGLLAWTMLREEQKNPSKLAGPPRDERSTENEATS